MTEPVPDKVVEIVVGLDGGFNYRNFYDPDKPVPLTMDLSERCELVFRLSDTLLEAGWSFQNRPIEVARDFGVNFSSYVWCPYEFKEQVHPRARFKIIYECARMGVYTYSLFMLDGLLQKITLDPDVENGAGRVP
jgi:hypothetical protein